MSTRKFNSRIKIPYGLTLLNLSKMRDCSVALLIVVDGCGGAVIVPIVGLQL